MLLQRDILLIAAAELKSSAGTVNSSDCNQAVHLEPNEGGKCLPLMRHLVRSKVQYVKYLQNTPYQLETE